MGDIWPSTTGKITIGRLGENERLRVHFPIANMLQELGEASFTLLHRGPGETTAYPIPTAERDGEYVIWTVTSRDTQTEGTGECQLVATVNGVIAKTMIWTTEITRSLDGSGEVPDVWESWQEVFAGLKADAEVAAEAAGVSSDAAASSAERSSGSAANASGYASQAHDSAASASQSAQSATGYASRAKDYMQQSLENLETATQCAEWAAEDADRAEAAAASIHDMTATAETLPEGSTATASYDSTSGTLTLGIPIGATGAQGPKGDTGETGPQGIQGETGPAGPAGYSPSAAVTQTPDGATITITDATGTTSATLSDSKIWDNLDAETNSYTPQVVIPCDDSGTVLSGVVTKRGRILYINGVVPSTLRVCIYGTFKATRSVPSYANFPNWYGDPFDGFTIGHTYRYDPQVLSGTIENASETDMLVLRQKDDSYKSIVAGTSAVCETLPEAVFVLLRAGTYINVKLYLHIVDVTASPVTDVQINGSSIVSNGIARINTPQWELIREETVTNVTEADIVINADSNGQAFELSDVRLVLVSPQQDTAFSKMDYGRVRMYYQTGAYDITFIGAYNQAAGATAKVSYIRFEQSDGMLLKLTMPNTSRSGMGPWQTYATEDGEGCFVLPDTPRVYNKINVTKVTGSLHYILYGKRKVV